MTQVLISFICKQCGKSVSRTKRYKGRMKYCSTNCAGIANAKRYLPQFSGQIGSRHPNWKGGCVTTGKRGGYRRLYVATVNGKTKYIQEHRAIAEGVLGRSLKKNEIVHHIDCNKTNNNHNNLIICTKQYHLMIHDRMEKAWVKEHIVAKRIG